MSTTSTRLHGDTRTLVVAVTALVAALGIVSFTAGVPGLMAVGAWALLPGWMSALVPVIVDGGILVFSLVAVVRRARHEGAIFAWSCLAILTLGSVAAQVAHVLLESGAVTATAIAGAVVAGAFPSVVFASTHAILDLAIAPAPRRGQHTQTAADDDARETGPAREQVTVEHVVEVVPAAVEHVAVQAPARTEQQVPEVVEQAVRPQASTEVEQATEAVERAARPVVVKASSTPARKPSSTAPAADTAAREQAVAAVLGGELSQSAAAAKFGVSRATLQRELVKAKQTAA
ncbi:MULTISPECIES: helix-turn-helix domain-containing protein [unclassified Pseudoclavibacter]|uniref:helix-turn-helix domain-containing protein n=1 Tax=unclassified Pseudoclavibacter TaxID=2615177 RepID=UPI001BAD11A6|nr:helix-turn-helix domain-containing protein [Pseudoclavibacter sp. Marseille-Q4354]MBS3180027.1 hypothetical protein [Pseudoclavibacter sp. Marseille-Q4354]